MLYYLNPTLRKQEDHMSSIYFAYGESEISHLKNCDAKLAEAINKIGHINRECNPDLFSALVNAIVGQQISVKAQATIWDRMKEGLAEITPENILACSQAELQSFGISFRKASYITGVAQKVDSGALDISKLHLKSDDEICAELIKLDGIGVWTAEMLLLFSLQRPNILSYSDLAILRGIRILYDQSKVTKTLFERLQERYSPYCSVASLYLWAIAGGELGNEAIGIDDILDRR